MENAQQLLFEGTCAFESEDVSEEFQLWGDLRQDFTFVGKGCDESGDYDIAGAVTLADVTVKKTYESQVIELNGSSDALVYKGTYKKSVGETIEKTGTFELRPKHPYIVSLISRTKAPELNKIELQAEVAESKPYVLHGSKFFEGSSPSKLHFQCEISPSGIIRGGGLEHGVEDYVLEGKLEGETFYLCKSISGVLTEFHGQKANECITGTWNTGSIASGTFELLVENQDNAVDSQPDAVEKISLHIEIFGTGGEVREFPAEIDKSFFLIEKEFIAYLLREPKYSAFPRLQQGCFLLDGRRIQPNIEIQDFPMIADQKIIFTIHERRTPSTERFAETTVGFCCCECPHSALDNCLWCTNTLTCYYSVLLGFFARALRVRCCPVLTVHCVRAAL